MAASYEPSAKRFKTDEESDTSLTDEESNVASDDDDAVVSDSAISSTIWEVVQQSAEKDFDGNSLDSYISLVRSWHYFKKDADHRKIMETLHRYQDGPDEMDFEEALLKAGYISSSKRVHLIERKVQEVKNSETDWL